MHTVAGDRLKPGHSLGGSSGRQSVPLRGLFGIYDGNMAEGSLRFHDCTTFRYGPRSNRIRHRAEVKRQPFRFIETINHEVQRQIELLEDGQSGTGNPPVRSKQRPDALHAQ
jgi:Asp-tRNA(Asn)/Glu-tRNA(Gln) amidotransferase B subunit